MKRFKTKLAIITVLVFVFTMVIGATAFAAWTSVQKVDAYSGVKVFFNGQEVRNPNQPLIINDSTYVPLRMIMELVGTGVTWDAANYRVMLTGASAGQLTAKDSEIADLKKEIQELQKELDDSESDYSDYDEWDDSESDYSDYDEWDDMSVNLVDLTPFTAVTKKGTIEYGAALHEFNKEYYSDNMGNSDYETGFTFSDSWATPVVREYTYIFDGEYDRFTGVMAVEYMSRNHTQEEYYGILTIYGDGYELYRSEELRGGVRPIDFDIDITGVDELMFTIEITTIGAAYSHTVLMLDPVLWVD